jgi:hypothetical protein
MALITSVSLVSGFHGSRAVNRRLACIRAQSEVPSF